MAKGFVRSIEGVVVTLVNSKEDVEVKKDEDGNEVPVETRVVKLTKATQFSINDDPGKRVSDLKNGDEVKFTEVGGVVVAGKVTREGYEGDQPVYLSSPHGVTGPFGERGNPQSEQIGGSTSQGDE